MAHQVTVREGLRAATIALGALILIWNVGATGSIRSCADASTVFQTAVNDPEHVDYWNSDLRTVVEMLCPPVVP